MHARTRVLSILVPAIAIVAISAPMALAGGAGNGWGNSSPSPSGNGVDSSAGQAVSNPGSGSSSSSADPCTSAPVPADVSGIGFANGGLMYMDKSGFDAAGNYFPAGTAGTWYVLTCPGGQSLVFAAAGRPVDPAQVAMMLRSHLVLPAPAIEMMPPVGHWQYVNVPAWLFLRPGSWRPLSQSLSVGGVTVTVTASPERVTWQLGNGTGGTDTVVCAGPGKPYPVDHPPASIFTPSPDCGYIWRHSSAGSADERVPFTAWVSYHATWSVSGAPGGGDFGLLPSFPTTVRVQVGQIEAVITDGS